MNMGIRRDIMQNLLRWKQGPGLQLKDVVLRYLLSREVGCGR